MSLNPFDLSRRYLYLVHANGPHGPPFSGPASKPPLRSITTAGHKPSPIPITSPPAFSTMTADRPNLYKSASESALRVPVTDGTTSGRSTPGENGSMDLNVEVAALSNKLINAINHQTQLDDSLSQTRHELEISRARVKQLEAVTKENADMLAKGLLVKKSDVEAETKRLRDRLNEGGRLKAKAEEEKRVIERELEGLTAALFGEANEMVSVARQKEEAVDKKNEQLRSQLADTQLLLTSHQEQLAELKQVIQQMTAEKEEAETAMSTGTPSTPALGNRTSKESLGRVFEALHLSPDSAAIEDIQPCPPTSLTNLIYPILRHDVPAYLDFCEVLHSPKGGTKTSPIPRLSSGSFSSIQAMGIGMGISYGSSSTNNSPTGLSSALFGARADKGNDSHPASPASVGSTANGNAQQQQIGLALKETKFYKRVLVEDIEPTLRVDLAPGLSWLARRNVSSAITDGSLQIDPLPMNSRSSAVSCSMCGESRLDEQHVRTHQMRTSDSTTALKHMLCTYCVNRTRSVCDFLAFLRTLKEGMWKCDSEGDEKHAWEECIKLRERMFWCRVGGGVIPAFIHRESARNSEEHGGPGSLRPADDETPRDLQSPRTPELRGYEGQVKLEVPKKRISKELPPILPQKASVSETPSPIAPSPIDKELPPPPRISLEKDSEQGGTTNEETIVEKQELAQKSGPNVGTTSEHSAPVVSMEPTEPESLAVPVAKTLESSSTTTTQKELTVPADAAKSDMEVPQAVPGAWW